jgi:hypothetical protein
MCCSLELVLVMHWAVWMLHCDSIDQAVKPSMHEAFNSTHTKQARHQGHASTTDQVTETQLDRQNAGFIDWQSVTGIACDSLLVEPVATLTLCMASMDTTTAGDLSSRMPTATSRPTPLATSLRARAVAAASACAKVSVVPSSATKHGLWGEAAACCWKAQGTKGCLKCCGLQSPMQRSMLACLSASVTASSRCRGALSREVVPAFQRKSLPATTAVVSGGLVGLGHLSKQDAASTRTKPHLI